MALSERLSTPPSPKPAPCGVRRVLAALSEADAVALAVARAGDEWTTMDIRSALRDEGHQVSYSTVFRHRKGECSWGSR